MATLVLSTVGNVLGGPVGGAIGALIGQSIDQQLLGSPRRGPRLGDLNVQTSSYGTQIPRVYGTMRVAGSVIWSTDLIESEQAGGAKGQPDLTYSYSVSFAVALSSRPAKSVGRIWADGKLLRGAAGDFKSSTMFRFYDGSEDQIIDPLIGSIEGVASAPAYRGLALAVFENFQLGDFGNRIPFLTFELIADDVSPTIGSILADASASAILSDANEQIIGFAAYGRSIKNAVEPLVDCFGVELFDDGVALKSTAAETIAIIDDELGNSSDNGKAPRVQREQLPTRAVPASLRLSYYDPARDYQTGEARAIAGEQGGNESGQELAAVLNASDAKGLAQTVLARAWAGREKLTLRLPPSRLALEPGSKLELASNPTIWTVEKASIEGFVVVAELRPSTADAASIVADPGRIVANNDVVAAPVTIALLDIPNVLGLASNEATLLIAATTATAGWKRIPVQIAFGGQSINSETATAKALLGSVETILAPGRTELVDDQNSVEIKLVDSNQWPTSCDDDALAAGDNLALIGSELVQFGDVTSLGNGRFRLAHLLRGRGGTEWAVVDHVAGETFCLMQSRCLQPVTMPSWSIGASVSGEVDDAPNVSLEFGAEGLRPPSPVNLATAIQPNGDLVISWTRRSRQGFAWIDGIDAPLGETSEQYQIGVTGPGGTVEQISDQPAVTLAPSELAPLGVGSAIIEVRQIGDFALSRSAQLTITLS